MAAINAPINRTAEAGSGVTVIAKTGRSAAVGKFLAFVTKLTTESAANRRMLTSPPLMMSLTNPDGSPSSYVEKPLVEPLEVKEPRL